MMLNDETWYDWGCLLNIVIAAKRVGLVLNSDDIMQ